MVLLHFCRTHIHWEQIKADEYVVVDDIWVVKDSTFPVFAPNPLGNHHEDSDVLVNKHNAALKHQGIDTKTGLL